MQLPHFSLAAGLAIALFVSIATTWIQAKDHPNILSFTIYIHSLSSYISNLI